MLTKERLEEIERKADEALVDEGIYYCNWSDFDIVLLARSHGFVVGNATMKNSQDGYLIFQSEPLTIDGTPTSGRVIGVNRERSGPCKRFVVAHTLGHYILGHVGKCPKGKNYVHWETQDTKNKEDSEADYFAAALLMPQGLYKNSYQELKKEGVPQENLYLHLATEYQVPTKYARLRMETLNLPS